MKIEKMKTHYLNGVKLVLPLLFVNSSQPLKSFELSVLIYLQPKSPLIAPCPK